MQYALQVFEYEDRNQFRTIDIRGEPWFVLADVCRVLEIGNPSQAASRLDDDEKGVITNDTPGGPQQMVVINESGLYSLILTSRKPEAKRFKKWVTSEVLPAIRKTGSYSIRPTTPAFIRRYNQNWDRCDIGHFSVISELVVRLWGRLEQLGHIMADRAAQGAEIRPDVSVGRLFAGWLRDRFPDLDVGFSYYWHWTPNGEFEARQYPNTVLPHFIEFVDSVWIPNHSEEYFRERDPAALPYLPRLLPSPDKPKPGMTRRVTRGSRRR